LNNLEALINRSLTRQLNIIVAMITASVNLISLRSRCWFWSCWWFSSLARQLVYSVCRVTVKVNISTAIAVSIIWIVLKVLVYTGTTVIVFKNLFST
jgi:hypothetical protein